MEDLHLEVEVSLSTFGLGVVMESMRETYSGASGVGFTLQLLWLRASVILNFG